MSIPPALKEKLALELLPQRVINKVSLWAEIADRVELTSICLGYPKNADLSSDVDIWDWQENEASGAIQYSSKMHGKVYSKIPSLPQNLPDIIQSMQKFMAKSDASVARIYRLTVAVFQGDTMLTEFVFQKSRFSK